MRGRAGQNGTENRGIRVLTARVPQPAKVLLLIASLLVVSCGVAGSCTGDPVRQEEGIAQFRQIAITEGWTLVDTSFDPMSPDYVPVWRWHYLGHLERGEVAQVLHAAFTSAGWKQNGYCDEPVGGCSWIKRPWCLDDNLQASLACLNPSLCTDIDIELSKD